VKLRFTSISIGFLRRGISPSKNRYLTQTQNKGKQAVGFELMSPVFERAKTFYASDGAATVIGTIRIDQRFQPVVRGPPVVLDDGTGGPQADLN
jgi:hypothetical protein